MTSREVVATYLEHNYRLVFWPAIGDQKGPSESGWTTKHYTIDDYKDGYRVGMLTGHEQSPGHFVHDVDIDWAPGSLIAQSMLPVTSFVFGRKGKPISHCFYTCEVALPSVRYEDPVDKTCLIELRGTKANGEIGMQTMIPPSRWSKNGDSEDLIFVRASSMSHQLASLMQHKTRLSAIGMLLAKHFGHNGFGHDPRLAWAGFLLRAGVEKEDLITMGQAISVYCNNTEVEDVRRVVETTAIGLERDGKKVKGGPALARLLGPHGQKILNRINEWLNRNQDFKRDEKGRPIKDSQENIQRAVEQLTVTLTYNEFAERMMIQWPGEPARRLEDGPMDALWLKIDRDYQFRPTYQFFEKVIAHQARSQSFHPVREYLQTLHWDHVERAETWLIESGHAEDTEYVREISRIFLVAAVRRIRHPGCKYDEMMVWVGEQGGGKSSAAQALCPDPTWFSDDLQLNVQSKELIEATLGKWIVEASDLAGKRKTEIEQLKALLSRQVDGPARMAYAHQPVERRRHFVIVGTTNSKEFLTDPTGGRRFWPVDISRFDLEWLRKHRDQLWAEACVREANGEDIRLPERLWPDATVQQEKRREMDPWEDFLREAVDEAPASTDGKKRIPNKKLWIAVGMTAIERFDQRQQRRISEIMQQRLGFKRATMWDAEEGKVVRGFEQLHAGSLEMHAGKAEPEPEPPF